MRARIVVDRGLSSRHLLRKHHFDQRARMPAGPDLELRAIGLDQRLGQREVDGLNCRCLIRWRLVRNGSMAAATSFS